MAVGDHFHPQLADAAVRVRHHGVDHGQGSRRAFGARLVQCMQDHAHDQRLAGLLPVRLQPLAVRVDDQGGEILHVAHLVLRIEADLVERIPAHAALGGGRLEIQHLAPRMLLAPARGQRPQFAFQVGDDGAVRPCEQGRHHQADTLAGAGGRVRQHVFRPVVAQVVLPASPVQPGPHVHAGAGRLRPSGQQLPQRARRGQQAGGADVRDVRPARRAVQVLAGAGRIHRDHPGYQQPDQSDARDADAHAARLHQRIRILPAPSGSPADDGPWRIDLAGMPAQRAMVMEGVGKELGGRLEAANEGERGQRRDGLAGAPPCAAHLGADGIIEPVFHLVRPFVLMTPSGVTVTASPRASWRKCLAAAPPTGRTIVAAPRSSSASTWPPASRSPAKTAGPLTPSYRSNFGISDNRGLVCSCSRRKASTAAEPVSRLSATTPRPGTCRRMR